MRRSMYPNFPAKLKNDPEVSFMFSTLKVEEADQTSEPRIALVDPDPRPSLLTSLKEAGYDVVSYGHPLKALEEIVDRPVKMAIVASELPWMSGSALARTLRDSYRVSEVVVMEKAMSDENILAKVRSGAPIDDDANKNRNRQRRQAAPAPTNSKATGRRILVRTARPR